MTGTTAILEIAKAVKVIERNLLELGEVPPIDRIVISHRAMRRLLRAASDMANPQSGAVGDGNTWCRIDGILFETEL